MASKEYPTGQVSNIEAAILGLLSERDRYGYELEKIIEDRHMRNWTEIGFSSIYYVLKRLERKGLVTSDVVQGDAGKPARKTYRVSPEGKKAIKDKVTHLLSNHIRVVSPFDLGLSFSGILEKPQITENLVTYMQSLDERITQLLAVIRSWKKNDPHSLAAAKFERRLYMMRAEKNWVKTFVKRLTAPHGLPV